MTIRAAQAHRPPPRLGALATGAGGTGRGHGCGRAARTGLGAAAHPSPRCSFLGLGAGLWSSVLPLHSSRMGGPCQAASLLLREPGGELAFHPQPRPGRVPTDHPRNSLGPPSGPLRQAFPPPGLWRGLCILRLSLGEALAGEDGGGEQLAPRLWAGHLEEHQHAVLKRWGGLCAPKPGLTDARLPAQAHPYLQICTEHPSRERGGRGGAGQGLCPPRALHRGPGSPHCPFVESMHHRRETALFVGGSCTPTTPAAPPSQSLGEGPSGPPSPV